MCVCVFEQKVEEEVELKKGSHIRVVTAETDKDKTDGKIIWVDYPSLPQVITKGGKIYIDDGLIGLKVTETGNVRPSCRELSHIRCADICFRFLALHLTL